MNDLTVGGIVSNSFKTALSNFVPLLGAAILWAITFWIPYLNIGTTIGLYGMAVTISKGGQINPTEIFNPKYRKNMGEFFLLLAFTTFGVIVGYAFVVIPGLVLAIAWGQAIFLFVDKGLSPLDAIRKSNEMTYGHKWTIFLGTFILIAVLMIGVMLLSYILGQVSPILSMVVMAVGYLAAAPIIFASNAYIYGELSKSADELGMSHDMAMQPA